MAQAGAPPAHFTNGLCAAHACITTTLPCPTAEPAQQKELSAALCVCIIQEEVAISREGERRRKMRKAAHEVLQIPSGLKEPVKSLSWYG